MKNFTRKNLAFSLIAILATFGYRSYSARKEIHLPNRQQDSSAEVILSGNPAHLELIKKSFKSEYPLTSIFNEEERAFITHLSKKQIGRAHV